MIYLEKAQSNTVAMNININARPEYTGYTFEFVHVMSKEVKTYLIDTSNTSEYQANDRYASVTLDFINDDLNYEGQYVLKVYGDGVDLVYNSMVVLEGTVEEPSFTTYVSPNEDNENYIYIQD
jgi:hypothetical protein